MYSSEYVHCIDQIQVTIIPIIRSDNIFIIVNRMKRLLRYVVRLSAKSTHRSKYYQNLPFARRVPLSPNQWFHVRPGRSVSICAQFRSNRPLRFDCRRRSLEMKVLTVPLFVYSCLTLFYVSFEQFGNLIYISLYKTRKRNETEIR